MTEEFDSTNMNRAAYWVVVVVRSLAASGTLINEMNDLGLILRRADYGCLLYSV